MSVILDVNTKLTKLKSKVIYNPTINYPAVTYADRGNNNFTVYAICYIPSGKDGFKSLPVEQFNQAEYPDGNGMVYKPTETIALVGNANNATVVLSYFDDILKVDALGNTVSSRSFALCYDFAPHNHDETYMCDVYALEFNYRITDGTNQEVIFMTQADLDPRMSRGGISIGSSPK